MAKKTPKKKKDDDYKRLLARNWLICVAALGLVIFFMYIYPMFAGGA